MSARELGRIPILVYHSVSRGGDIGELAPYTISPDRFADHLAYLRDNGYSGYTVTALTHAMAAGQALADRAVVLTFDDGFVDFQVHAVKRLAAAGFPATLYVPSAYLGGTSDWLVKHPEDRRPILEARQLRELADSGIEIGAHSHSHAQLDLVSADVLEREITLPKQLLEEAIGTSVPSFAYPFGYYSGRVARAVARAGYSSACRVDELVASTKSHLFALPRLTVTAGSTVEDLESLLSTAATRRAAMVADAKRLVWRGVRRTGWTRA
jgi:peptidoglycan/xylan/chitin deacetylase (PgdA/CDA1 family)